MTAATLAPFAAAGSAAYAALAIVLAIGAGVIQCIAGLARLGRMIDRIPPSLMLASSTPRRW